MSRAATTSDGFNAIGDPARRAILDALADGERTVSALVHTVGLTQPQVSKHLAVLRDVDLVSVRAVGRERLYRINTESFTELHGWFDQFVRLWNDRFNRLDAVLAESQPTTERKRTS